jgi:hydroxyacylglutathione hydrolase
MSLIVEQIPVLQDNYIYLVHDTGSGATAVIDPAVSEPVLELLAAKGWVLSHILNTHHHNDHVGGNLALKQATGATIVGSRKDATRIPGLDIGVDDGDSFMLGQSVAKVMEVPGHTSGHIAYWFAEDHALFCGDTLFALGCGRLFEGTGEQMWNSLQKFRALPDDALIYCAHEYTESNARFAATIERGNQDLLTRIIEIGETRKQHLPTVPSRLGIERKTNPFLRADQDSVKAAVGLQNAAAAQVFTEVRRRKDIF